MAEKDWKSLANALEQGLNNNKSRKEEVRKITLNTYQGSNSAGSHLDGSTERAHVALPQPDSSSPTLYPSHCHKTLTERM
jgi:hypothetical protein